MHYEWATQNKKLSSQSLAAELLEVEQTLSINQEETFLHAENPYISAEIEGKNDLND